MYYVSATAVVSFEEKDIEKSNQFLVTINLEIPSNILPDNYLEYVVDSIKNEFNTGNYKNEGGVRITSSNISGIDADLVTGSVANFISNLTPFTAVLHRG